MIALSGLVALAGCSGQDSTASVEDGGRSLLDSGAPPFDAPGADARPSMVDAAEPEPVVTEFAIASGLAGQYVAKITFRKVESASILGTLNALVTLYGLFEVRVDDAAQKVWLDARYCHAELSGEGTGLLTNSGVVTPDIVMSSTVLVPVEFSANVDSSGQTVWSVPDIIGFPGWMPVTETDTLPTSASDTRVFDQDSDGHPGVTTQVLLGGSPVDVYVVQYLRDRYAGSVASNGDLAGSVWDSTLQNVLGSPNALLASASLVETPDPDTSDNRISLRRIAIVPSCEELVANPTRYLP